MKKDLLDFLSGSFGKTYQGASESFSILYGANHRFYGLIAHFLNIPADTNQRHLIDPYPLIVPTPFRNCKPSLDLHEYYLMKGNILTIK